MQPQQLQKRVEGIILDKMKRDGLTADRQKEILNQLQWTVIDGVVYDITFYIDDHPGGRKKILRGVGKDSSEMFHKFHKGLKIDRTPLALLAIGTIDELIPRVTKQLPEKTKAETRPQTFGGISVDDLEDSSSDEGSTGQQKQVGYLSVKQSLL